MVSKFRDWLDARTNYRKLMAALLLEHIPGGAKWRYVWGSTLTFVFFIQLVTGVLLMTAYSPGDTAAWSSVFYIQYQMDFGWFIRGLHHFGSQTMVVLLAVHMLQVVIAGAQLPPREVNWWLGLLLMGCVLGLSLTGYLLPWDQKGFWATRVATNIAGTLPVLGPEIARFAVGGPEYGNATLTRFFALHVAILPPLMIVLIIAHIAVFRKQGLTANVPEDHPKQGVFWPDQAFKDLVACLVVFAVMVSLVVFGGQGNKIETEAAAGAEVPGLYEDWAKAGRKGMGANLDAPADRTKEFPARPEWYFLFLFQLLKYFEGPQILIGTVAIPQGAGLLLFLLPFFGIGKLRPFGRVLGVIVVLSLIVGAATLTILALADDTIDPVLRELLTQLALYVVPAAGGFYLLYLGLLAVLPHGVVRKVVYGFGVLVLVTVLGLTGFLIYATQADNEHLAVRSEEKIKLTVKDREYPEGSTTPREVWEFARDELQKKEHAESSEQHAARAKRQGEIEKHFKALKEAHESAERAVLQASRGIPAEGPVFLVRNDPMTRGRELFKTKCATCHSYTNPKTGLPEFETPKSGFTASDLGGFGSKDWILGMIERADDDKYFGRAIKAGEARNKPLVEKIEAEKKKITDQMQKLQKSRSVAVVGTLDRLNLPYLVDAVIQVRIEDLKANRKRLKDPPVLGGMATWSAEQRQTREAFEKIIANPKASPEEKADAKKSLKNDNDEIDRIAAWLAKQPTADPPKADDQGEFARGYRAFKQTCMECHGYGDKGSKSAPNLKGYGSPQWTRLMVMFPTHPERYPNTNLMPAFRNLDGPAAQVNEQVFQELHQDRKVEVIALNDIERELICASCTRTTALSSAVSRSPGRRANSDAGAASIREPGPRRTHEEIRHPECRRLRAAGTAPAAGPGPRRRHRRGGRQGHRQDRRGPESGQQGRRPEGCRGAGQEDRGTRRRDVRLQAAQLEEEGVRRRQEGRGHAGRHRGSDPVYRPRRHHRSQGEEAWPRSGAGRLAHRRHRRGGPRPGLRKVYRQADEGRLDEVVRGHAGGRSRDGQGRQGRQRR